MISVPVAILTFNLTVCNNAPAVIIRDVWNFGVHHFPQDAEKIVFARTCPEIAHEKFVVGRIVHIGLMTIMPLICLGTFGDYIGKVRPEEIVLDGDHYFRAFGFGFFSVSL
jgi:hypothetical protein